MSRPIEVGCMVMFVGTCSKYPGTKHWQLQHALLGATGTVVDSVRGEWTVRGPAIAAVKRAVGMGKHPTTKDIVLGVPTHVLIRIDPPQNIDADSEPLVKETSSC